MSRRAAVIVPIIGTWSRLQSAPPAPALSRGASSNKFVSRSKLRVEPQAPGCHETLDTPRSKLRAAHVVVGDTFRSMLRAARHAFWWCVTHLVPNSGLRATHCCGVGHFSVQPTSCALRIPVVCDTFRSMLRAARYAFV